MNSQETIKLLSLIKETASEKTPVLSACTKNDKQAVSVHNWLCSIYAGKYLCPLKAEMAMLAASNHLGR